ncbi:MAG: type VII toxin-antitoxin system HepT family RNase toxin [Candidatus Rokuibacteriota bacterium]
MREHVDRARRRRPESVDVFRHDVDLQDALAMSLLVAVQEAIDVGFHIVADEGWGVPSSYAEGFEILARRGLLDEGLADDLARAVAVRHRIAHGYATLDAERFWSEVPAGLDALDRFAAAIARFLPADAG